jgi:hypothetical protein
MSAQDSDFNIFCEYPEKYNNQREKKEENSNGMILFHRQIPLTISPCPPTAS